MVENVATGVLTWTVEAEAPWLALDPDAGVAAPETPMLVTVNRAGLELGLYTSTNTVAGLPGCANSPQAVPVSLVVEPAPVIEVSPSQVSVTAPVDALLVEPVRLAVSSAGGDETDWQAASDVPWFSVQPDSGTSTTHCGCISARRAWAWGYTTARSL